MSRYEVRETDPGGNQVHGYSYGIFNVSCFWQAAILTFRESGIRWEHNAPGNGPKTRVYRAEPAGRRFFLVKKID